MATILIIDDDAPTRRMIGRTLVEAGHHVVEATDGVEGVRQFRASAPDLIVTDIIMPEQEGIQTIAEIRAMAESTSIIAISGGGVGGGQFYLNMAKGLGADATLAKPFRPSELISLINHLLELNPAITSTTTRL
jgi:CheY-like chemotaxis protein